MSIFGDDGMSGMLQDDLNENINEDNLPGASDGEENAEGGDDDENKVPVKVEPKTRRTILNPRPRLTVELLKGERGLHTIENHFKDIKFAGKGHEKSDLNEVMRRLQHWGHRLCPNFKFDDILLTIERLSKKKPLQIHMNNYRQDLLQPIASNAEVHAGLDDDEANAIDEPFDEFDALIGEQIAISKLTSAPQTPRSVWSDYSVNTNAFTTPKLQQGNAAASTPYQFHTPGPSSPQPAELPEPEQQPKLSSELMAKIAENRRLAQERLRAKAEAANQELFS